MPDLLIEKKNNVLVISFNRPEKHNALNTNLTKSLYETLENSEYDAEIRAIVLTGIGKSFCAGADTTEFSTLTPQNPEMVLQRADLTMKLHSIFSKITKPIIAAVHGNALGGGAGLALACDMIVMAEDAKFGYPELRHGIVAAIVIANLVRQLGRKQAFELVALSEFIDGNKAKELGIVNRVCSREDVLSEAISLAERLASWSPIAMATTKRTFYRACDLSLEAALNVGRDANVMMRGFNKS